MNSTQFNLRKMTSSLLVFSLSLLVGSQLANAAALSGNSGTFDMLPPAIQAPDAKPIVMLAMSNDHQLFYKAYTDYDDIFDVANGVPGEDGTLDTTYTDEFDYYGYFDSRKCYNYVVNRFEPVGMAHGTNNHDCDNGGTAQYWSGNFLNWLTMSRMDIVRKVLYGGYRSTDTATDTVLERAHIPSDNHAWSKYFPSTDLLKYTPYSSALHPNGLTFCNVTPRGGQEFSENNVELPQLRVAFGQWADWASQEREQCLWEGEDGFASNNGESPDDDISTEFKAELNVRVKVCDSSLLGTENCKSYGTAIKPIGLLHTYGENGSMDFGLITGSYEKGKSGGVLRKNISDFTDEINANGTFNTSTNGIISTINLLRISRYSYDDNGYGDGAVDNCPYDQNTWVNGECSNWGNPMGEIYLEALRYYSGAGAGRTEFQANNDATWIPGIATNVTWRDPYGAAITTAPIGGGYEQCSKPNIITLSTGVLGFDHDEYTGAADVGGTLVVNTETDAVGTGELNGGSTYYIGSTGGGSANDVCAAQSIANLSSVTGLCPEAAGLQGSFKLAGLAYYAHKSTTDLRTTASGNDVSGTQNVNTYSIALAPPIPDIKVDVGGNQVRIIPVAHNWRNNNAMVLVNFQVISQTATTGEFFMNYENAPAGADHDSDFKGYLKYEVSGNTISITAHNTGSSAGSTMHLGYLIDGVTDPGIYYVASNRDVTNQVQTDTNNYSITQADIDSVCGALTLPASGFFVRCSLYEDLTLTRLATNGEINSANSRDLRGARTHTAGSSSAELLQSPMWYAAKWGNFNDLNNNNTPDLITEWDIQNNNTGDYTPDGIPDSYYLVTNPQVLETQLSKTLNEILQRASSGTAAAVIADTVSMTGAVVQALYQPRLARGGDLISWAGLVHSVFIDEYGNLREDTNQNGALDVPATDKYIQIKYSADVGRTQIYECTSSDSGLTLTCPLADRKEVEELLPIWNARDRLADVPDTRITAHRAYADPFLNSSTGGRHIITWLDNNFDDMVDSGETVAFIEGSITASNFRYLNSDSEAEAENIVNFIRGKEGITGFRSRTIDYDNDTVREAWRLGDIVHSTPLIVSQPTEKWDVLYGDTTYTTFRAKYANRRNVVYVGANDGMLHAFNAGFFDVANSRFCKAANCSAQTNDTAHPLGAELWAYVPKNLLPHLRWLAEPDYPHVFYMDGKAQAFDVNIFPYDPNDANDPHPGGWGTILVAGMRLGGGELPVDLNNDATVDYTARSGYVILDITDPEVAPKVLGEFTDPALGYSSSTPTLVVKRQPDPTTLNWADAGSGTLPNDWYLVFGSGPTDLTEVTSNQYAQLFTVKLVLDSTSGALDLTTTGIVNTPLNTGIVGFVGDPVGVDWSSDFLSDAVYFGIAGGTPAAPSGKLMRLKLDGNTAANWTSFSPLIDSGQPFINKPEIVSLDASPLNEWWVYAGTGRLYVNADNTSTAQQSFYGIREQHDSGTSEDYPEMTFTANITDDTDTNYAQNVTGITVFGNGAVTIPSPLDAEFPTGTDTFSELETHIDGKKGWFLNYSTSPVASRSLTRATFWRDFVLFTSYTPPTDTCTPEGYSDLYALYGGTGTAHPTAGLNLFGTQLNAGVGDKLPSTYLSVGIASEITTYDTLKGTKPIIQMSTGEIVDTGELSGLGIGEGRQSWRELLF